MTKQGMMQAGLIGAYISRTRCLAALRLMCDEAGLKLGFQLIDTAGMADFGATDADTCP